jgi:3-methyl-2-oxobutanoate hydroxymethyltransferase
MGLESFLEQFQRGKKLVVLTAYDVQMAGLLELSGVVDAILVGDSLGMVFQGKNSTREVTVEQMAYHTAAVRRGAAKSFIITDMPFGSDLDPTEALANAQVLLEAGADAVKIEGRKLSVIRTLVGQQIPVMGHLGLLPQTAESFTVQGKNPQEAQNMRQDALALQEAGAFSMVLECIPTPLGTAISHSVDIPTIGIGAGPDTSGQVLVINDLLGLGQGKYARFVRQYTNLGQTIMDLVQNWAQDIARQDYPSPSEQYN